MSPLGLGNDSVPHFGQNILSAHSMLYLAFWLESAKKFYSFASIKDSKDSQLWMRRGRDEDAKALRSTMWLWYDWRAAAVADDTGAILDVEQWDGFYDQKTSWPDLNASLPKA